MQKKKQSNKQTCDFYAICNGMGFKNAWELVSKKLPLLGINHFFFSLHKVPDSYKRGEKQKKELGWYPVV